MKLDLHTKELYTDHGKFLKTLECPEKVNSSELERISTNFYNCSACKKTILETSGLTDDQLVEILRKDPQQCIKVNINQPNLKLR